MSPSLKILLVDDERRFCLTTKKILEHEGFEVIFSESGTEALSKLSENPDVVVLDIKMPGMDGHETLEKMKEIAPDLPIIILTGHGFRSSSHKAMSRGAFEYLTKPCDIPLLIAKLRSASERSHT